MNWSRLFTISLFLILPAPVIVVVAASLSSVGYIRFPPGDLSLRWYAEFLSDQRWLDALVTSVLLALVGAVVTTTVSVMAALAVARKSSRWSALFEATVLAPLIFPHAALGMAMVALAATFHVYGTFAGLVLTHCIVTLPFAYRPIAASLRKLDVSLEEAAMSLGSRPWNTFFTVVLPMIRPGIVTSLLFSFIISFDEVTITMFLVGPEVTTLPVAIYSYIQESGKPVVAAISSALVATTLLFVLILERFVGLELFVEAERVR